MLVLVLTLVYFSVSVLKRVIMKKYLTANLVHVHGSFHQVGAQFCEGVNCYIRKCTIFYP